MASVKGARGGAGGGVDGTGRPSPPSAGRHPLPLGAATAQQPGMLGVGQGWAPPSYREEQAQRGKGTVPSTQRERRSQV